ncbi:hypothetical protein [Nesterenkonia pannonica]|uniref:hypothetical protein n=1 Tax=Nesterenkonia pannonica TaxID=1548602 RepID=UPI0021646F4F|nr:hypothetical protein [Nesterenkonia pannonica]
MSLQPCDACGELYASRSNNSKYCANRCRRANQARQQAAYREKERAGFPDETAQIQQSKDALAAWQKRMSRDAQKLARRHRRRVPA